MDVVSDGSHAYCATGDRLRILNLSAKERPKIVAELALAGACRDIAFIDEGLVVIPNGVHLIIIDVSNAASPELVSSIRIGEVGPESVWVDSAKSRVYSANRERGLAVVDLADKAKPVLRGRREKLGDVRDVAVSGDTAYLATDTGIAIVDVSAPRRIKSVGTVTTKGPAWTLHLVDCYLLVGEDGGLCESVDCSNPNEPKVIGELALGTSASITDIENSDATIYVSTVDGVYAVDWSTKEAPHLLGQLRTPAGEGKWAEFGVRGMAVESGLAYTVTDRHWLWIVHLKPPSKMRFTGKGGKWLYE